MACVWIGVAVVVAAGVVWAIGLSNAMKRYRDSLERLKRDPHNPDLRETTLVLGRRYASITRGSKLVTVFDEVALMNDINAACARAGTQVPASRENSEADIEARLKKLERLLSQGLITQDEFRSRRQAILDEV
jgi:hypothetical protein